MLQLNNKTPFAAAMALFPNEECIDTLYVMVQSSFNIGRQWTLLANQPAPIEADVHWGEPETTSLKTASDYHVGKTRTDIIMTGLACALNRQKVSSLDVSLAVGKVAKTVRVFGDRQWLGGRMTEPALFETMPMVYEKAFGGMHLVDGEVDSCEDRNPVGCGFAGNRSAIEMDGVPLPNLEDPRDLISSHEETPKPACFAYCSPGWQPRANYAGTYGEDWQTRRAPYLPEDFDKRFFNMAHSDLIYPGYLQGGEPVSISGMHPNGDLQFELPTIDLTALFKVNGKLDQVNFNLETLKIEPNLLQLSMLWRAAYPCDKKALQIEEVIVSPRH